MTRFSGTGPWFAALERKATDIYGSARTDGLLKFCQEVIAGCCEARKMERAYAQACTNLATIRPSYIEGATIGDDAQRYHDALLAGWGGIEGWHGSEDTIASQRAEDSQPGSGA